MKEIKIDTTNVGMAVSAAEVAALQPEVAVALSHLHNGTGAGNDFIGWVDLPTRTPEELIDDIMATAQDMRERCDTVVCIGIGGSYLGAKAVIHALSPAFPQPGENSTEVVFAGNNISEDYLYELQQYLRNRRFGIIVISKSGTTTEPAIAFRLLREQLEKAVGHEDASRRIIAITDAKRGALRQLATQEGYKTYVIEDSVGGRFSVLTPVGLLPIAVAGHDIRNLIEGARKMQKNTININATNIAGTYATIRNALYRAGKKIEILVNYDPRLHYLAEWWKQLFGESEGKQHRGIFPASVDNTTDLHSMGQWIQDGERTIFETVISVEKVQRSLTIPREQADLDGLNYIADLHIDRVNKMAEAGTRLAHVDGGVPNICITLPAVNEYYIGQLLYFFEKACGISGYILGVNPFNQPGVEDYKRNMFALLDKPGFEEQSAAIRKRLGC